LDLVEGHWLEVVLRLYDVLDFVEGHCFPGLEYLEVVLNWLVFAHFPFWRLSQPELVRRYTPPCLSVYTLLDLRGCRLAAFVAAGLLAVVVLALLDAMVPGLVLGFIPGLEAGFVPGRLPGFLVLVIAFLPQLL
jgi:hypothetical protein